MSGPEDILKNLARLRGKQPQPTDLRMKELIGKFGGTSPDPSLPMDTASRLGRATEQGFTNDLYHGTRKDFSEFGNPVKLGSYGEGDFGIHVTPRPDTANRFTGDYHDLMKEHPLSETSRDVVEARGGNVMPLKVRMDKTLHMPKDVGIWRDPQSWVAKHNVYPEIMDRTNDSDALGEILDRAADINSRYRGNANHVPFDPSGLDRSLEFQQDALGILQRRGIDSISYPNTTEGAGELSYLLTDPRKIRSRFAAFDPRNLGKKDILGSAAVATGAGAGYGMSQEENDAMALAKQANDPWWKKAGRAAVEGGTDLITGALGLSDGGTGVNASNIGELLAAGLPMLPKRMNFKLPDGKVTAPAADGSHQILDGEAAQKLYGQLTKTPTHRLNRESGEIPRVSGRDEISDLAVPIADSLDTAATPKLPLTGILKNEQDSLKRRTASVGRDDIMKIRELYDQGVSAPTIHRDHFPHLNSNTVSEIARRLSFQRVK